MSDAWEYITRYMVSDQYLNDLGNKGWELVSITNEGLLRTPLYTFKRKKNHNERT